MLPRWRRRVVAGLAVAASLSTLLLGIAWPLLLIFISFYPTGPIGHLEPDPTLEKASRLLFQTRRGFGPAIALSAALTALTGLVAFRPQGRIARALGGEPGEEDVFRQIFWVSLALNGLAFFPFVVIVFLLLAHG